MGWIDDEMDTILAAAVEEFASCGSGGEPCYAARVPGGTDTDVLCEDAGCGQLTLRLVSAYHSNDFPNPAEYTGLCAKPITYSLVLRLMRCYEDTDQRGEAAAPDIARIGSIQQNADMLGMLRAINCDSRDRLTQIGTFQPEGPTGNFVGGSWDFQIAAVD